MSDLNDFLKEDAEPEPVAETPPVELTTPEPEAKPEPETAGAEPEGEEDPRRMIPAAVMHAERRERQDWKEKAVRAETERDALRQQLEEAKRGPAIQPQAPQPINPVEDPQGFIARVQEVAISNRLDMSEMLLRKEIGAEAVDAMITEFKAAAAQNPALSQQLYAQPHPYEWAHKQVERIRAQAEIGDDPAAYRAKLEADLRAKWEAEQGAAPAPRVSPAAGLAPSLANARSAASRSAPTYTGPDALEDIFRTR